MLCVAIERIHKYAGKCIPQCQDVVSYVQGNEGRFLIVKYFLVERCRQMHVFLGATARTGPKAVVGKLFEDRVGSFLHTANKSGAMQKIRAFTSSNLNASIASAVLQYFFQVKVPISGGGMRFAAADPLAACSAVISTNSSSVAGAYAARQSCMFIAGSFSAGGCCNCCG